MVSTTLLLRLQKAIGYLTPHSLCFRSIGLRLMLLCIPLITGCGDIGNAGNDLATANAGHGKRIGYGLNNASAISLTPTTFTFSVTQGESNPVHSVSISNSGNGPLDWSVSTSATWLTLSPLSGTSSGNAPASFTATANISGLAAGTYSTIIIVAGVGATNTPQSIPVTLEISTSTSSTSLPTTTTATSSTTTSTPTTSASALLTWNPEADPSVIGYYVHYGTQSPNSVGSCAYAQSIYYSLASLANASSPAATVSSLATGTTYFFAVSAY